MTDEQKFTTIRYTLSEASPPDPRAGGGEPVERTPDARGRGGRDARCLVATITLARPEALNAFDDAMLEELPRAVRLAERDPNVRALVITGEGKAFSSGQDLKSIQAKGGADAGRTGATGEGAIRDGAARPPSLGSHLRRHYNPLILKLREMAKPVIAGVNGIAAGAGMSLALACDLRVVSEKARFLPAFVKAGLVPDSGLSYFLPRIIGAERAFAILATGAEIDARKAIELGIASASFPESEFEAGLQAFARTLALGPTRSIGYLKKMFLSSAENPLSAHLALEADLQELAGRTADHQEGLRAFLEKRKPAFAGQ